MRLKELGRFLQQDVSLAHHLTFEIKCEDTTLSSFSQIKRIFLLAVWWPMRSTLALNRIMCPRDDSYES